MNALAVMLLLSTVGSAPGTGAKAEQQVDLIELNHFLDEDSRHVFDQVIFYQWSHVHRRYHVIAWRLIKDPSQVPQRIWNPPVYRSVWMDDGIMRCVEASTFRETWSQVDPERVNRKLLPQEHRIGLHKIAPLQPDDSSPDGPPMAQPDGQPVAQPNGQPDGQPEAQPVANVAETRDPSSAAAGTRR